jgi:hypothetical protein
VLKAIQVTRQQAEKVYEVKKEKVQTKKIPDEK